MAILTNPITAQNIVDRFADYVTTTANTGIVWGTNARPFTEMSTATFGGTTSGRAIGVTGTNVTSVPITASTIYNALVAETQLYTNIRLLNARLFVLGGGGNTGSRPTPGVVYNQTSTAYLNVTYRQTLSTVADAGVTTNQVIIGNNLQQFFDNCKTAYNAARSTIQQIQVDVCHASCHSSCHGSRGRR